MNELYVKCFNVVLKNEGFYSNDINDRGGETIMGISRNNFPNWKGWIIVDQCKATNTLDSLRTDVPFMELVQGWYKENFWDTMNLDSIAEVSLNLAMEMFDTGVNCYWMTVAKWFQRALNAMNLNQSKYFVDLVVDGNVGPASIAALKSLPPTEIPILIQILNGLQISHYINIAEKDKTQEKFVRGWIKNRCGFINVS